MCLAIPGRVEQIGMENGIRMGRMNFGGVVKKVCLDYVPEIAVGDYAIVHVGFALSRIDEETAEKTLADFRAMGVLEEELASEEEAFARAAADPESPCPDCIRPGDQSTSVNSTSTSRRGKVGLP